MREAAAATPPPPAVCRTDSAPVIAAALDRLEEMFPYTAATSPLTLRRIRGSFSPPDHVAKQFEALTGAKWVQTERSPVDELPQPAAAAARYSPGASLHGRHYHPSGPGLDDHPQEPQRDDQSGIFDLLGSGSRLSPTSPQRLRQLQSAGTHTESPVQLRRRMEPKLLPSRVSSWASDRSPAPPTTEIRASGAARPTPPPIDWRVMQVGRLKIISMSRVPTHI